MQEKSAFPRRYRQPTTCSVCENVCQYFFYSVPSCDACKHFFRRAIVLKKEFVCKNVGMCNVAKGEKCKSCRFDKCLLAGMNARAVRSTVTKELLDGLDQRRKQLMQRNSPEEEEENDIVNVNDENCATGSVQILQCLSSSSSSEFQLLQYLMSVEGFVRKIRTSSTPIPEQHYQGHCQSMVSFLSKPTNLLTESANFSSIPPKPMNSFIINWIRQNGTFSRRPPYLALDLLLVVEIAKTLPFFNKIDMKDKLCLITSIAMPLVVLSNSFYSYQKSSKTILMPTGHAPIEFFNGERYGGDKNVLNLSTKSLTDVMEPFHRVQLTDEEFVLLRAIIYSHMVTTGLSTRGQKILLAEAEKYCSILMNIMQTRYGPMAGASKFAEAMQIVEFCFNSGRHHSEFMSYMANVHERDHFYSVIPGALAQLCTRGNAQMPQLRQL